MLFTQEVLERIAAGDVDLAFRRWRRPAVRPGTTLRTAVGVLAVEAVDAVDEDDVSDQDARRAGYADRALLLADQRPGADRTLYRVTLRPAGDDPRVRLRQDTDLTAAELDDIAAALARMDARSSHGPWTTATLELIAAHPAVRAADLAARAGRERLPFKADVRKLKERGLTESLDVGYRLSPRGRLVLDHVRRRTD
ncbi:hypothetical protein ABT390_03915 [Streptomyces aurantiacus]|uniref:ASCH domain-containing protein n=1 Tax=Streptomyces aurantiacus JA 4570 TaxID=1286094 RepID=S4A3S3_9ACTN|nr:hypothetical protein [Streptomyces aurantiacus]EPH45365.1 hypothetical protein STRAU_1561 [Streptomyces aurantiacus JA 4570]